MNIVYNLWFILATFNGDFIYVSWPNPFAFQNSDEFTTCADKFNGSKDWFLIPI
jgi:hypothetical protein